MDPRLGGPLRSPKTLRFALNQFTRTPWRCACSRGPRRPVVDPIAHANHPLGHGLIGDRIAGHLPCPTIRRHRKRSSPASRVATQAMSSGAVLLAPAIRLGVVSPAFRGCAPESLQSQIAALWLENTLRVFSLPRSLRVLPTSCCEFSSVKTGGR